MRDQVSALARPPARTEHHSLSLSANERDEHHLPDGLGEGTVQHGAWKGNAVSATATAVTGLLCGSTGRNGQWL